MSCVECVREEIIGPRARDGAVLPLAEVLTSGDINHNFHLYSDDGWQNLPSVVPPGTGRLFDEGDRRLAAATDSFGSVEDDGAWLVTDDEDYFSNLLDECVQAEIAVFPVASCRLLLSLNECGAISDDDLEAVLQAEEGRLDSDQQMQPHKRAAKRDALDRIAVRLAAKTA